MSRPFDELNKSAGQPVLVRLKGEKILRGTLSSFDVHLNIILENAEELSTDPEQGPKEKHAKVMVRGDNIIFIAL